MHDQQQKFQSNQKHEIRDKCYHTFNNYRKFSTKIINPKKNNIPNIRLHRLHFKKILHQHWENINSEYANSLRHHFGFTDQNKFPGFYKRRRDTSNSWHQ